MLENRTKLPGDQVFNYEMEWYGRDQGRSALREIIEVLEKAAAATP